METREFTSGSVEFGEKIDSVSIRAPKGDLPKLPKRIATTLAELPGSGQVASFGLTDPVNPREPKTSFKLSDGARELSVAVLTFRKQAAPAKADVTVADVAVADVEGTKSSILSRPATRKAGSGERRRARKSNKASAQVLAYAPAPRSIEAPFDAVMGGERRDILAEEQDTPAFVPRPRPGATVLTAWLGDRSLGEFGPQKHDWADDPLPPNVKFVAQRKCLAEGIYFEARGESEAGQAAVAQVILNRVRNPVYPKTICGVVYQNKQWRNRCQFSFACDGIPNSIRSPYAWRVATRIADDVLDGKMQVEDIGDATHYYADYVRPGWASRMIRMDKIGAHIFYRTKNGGLS